jgi:hypothetical protein
MTMAAGREARLIESARWLLKHVSLRLREALANPLFPRFAQLRRTCLGNGG